jgi:hypothetical protein
LWPQNQIQWTRNSKIEILIIYDLFIVAGNYENLSFVFFPSRHDLLENSFIMLAYLKYFLLYSSFFFFAISLKIIFPIFSWLGYRIVFTFCWFCILCSFLSIFPFFSVIVIYFIRFQIIRRYKSIWEDLQCKNFFFLFLFVAKLYFLYFFFFSRV